MDLYMVVLRAIHILAGVFWVGSFLLFFLFVGTTARDLGPQGAPFMTHLVRTKKLPLFVTGAGGITVLAGALLYWRTSGGLDTGWITTGTGMTFTLGAVAAIVALAVGIFGIKPTVDRIGAIGESVAASGAAPSQEQMQELGGLQRRSRSLGWVNVALLTFAVLAMATARYL